MRARVWLWILVPLLIAALLAIRVWSLGTLEQAIACDQFKRLPDGGWVAAEDVSLTYGRYVGQYNVAYGKGTVITGTGDSEGARLLDALNKVCGKK